MKKAILFAVAVSLSSAAFAGGLEDFKSQSFTDLNAKTINSTDVIMPMGIQGVVTETVESDKRVVWNRWSWDRWSWGGKSDGNKRAKYFFQTNGNGNLVCADESGVKGYNKIAVNKFLFYPQKGECADIRGANLRGYDLRKANLNGADLRGVELSWADLSKVDLRRSNLSGAKLYQTRMSRADLRESDLSNSNLSGIYLSWADLRMANLSSSNLSESIMIGADLSGADLSGSDLAWTDLRETKLMEADLSGVFLKWAKYDSKTTLPFDDNEARKRGMIKMD